MDMTLTLAYLGGQEIALVAVGVLVLFGAKKLPELARGMGEGMREFKKAVKDVTNDDEPATTPAAATPSPAVTTDDPKDVENRIVH